MALPTRFALQGLMPAFAAHLAVERVGSLPWGGPLDGSFVFKQGSALGAVQVAAQSEVVTLSISGAPTGGTFTPVLNFDKPYVLPAQAFNVTLANFQAALIAAVPEFNGNITVTGTAGTTYTCTFNNAFANQRIGGLWSVTNAFTGGTTPSAAWARTTRGSCGLAQLDLYSQASNNHVDAFLRYDTTLTPGGGLVPSGMAGSVPGLNQPYQPTVYIEGIFDPNDLVGVDANAYTLGTLLKTLGGLYARLI